MKRIIFTLLYSDGQFLLSRNFRLQKVGDFNWLTKNYDIENITNFIDELAIIDLSPKKNKSKFLNVVKKISKKAFIPIAAGGGITGHKDVEDILDSGSDKIIVNSLFFEKPLICKDISDKYGRQFLVGSLDYKYFGKKIKILNSLKNKFNDCDINYWINYLIKNGAGEILLQSIDKDGTGMGLDKKILKKFKKKQVPIILMGGVGNYEHILSAIKNKYCDAVSTANLFNFIGNEFYNSRKKLEKSNKIPIKNEKNIQQFKKIING